MHLNSDRPQSSGTGSERNFALCFVLIGVLVAAVLAHELLERAGVFSDDMHALISSAEMYLHVLTFVLVCAAAPMFVREMRRRRHTMVKAQEAREQIALLFRMTDMLQSALGHADANSVLRSTALTLMPGFAGALYIFNNSGDRLELSTSWSWRHSVNLPDAIFPDDCWAIKRGKSHLNLPEDNALCCEHHDRDGDNRPSMEIPMMARGEVYGLLIVECGDACDAQDLRAISNVAMALSDAMSLSLSNLALRERLRTQALRDALTGLYNRRYMEDSLARHVDLASRSAAPLSVIMIDLDHFKKLNDQAGHAMGDAVLVDVAAAILGAIRPCDIACRYGGEELLVLMPDCALSDAAARAEVLRGRIERLSERHGLSVSASFGVSALRETSGIKNLVADADRALYRAKHEGRNRVTLAALALSEVVEVQACAA